MAPTDLRPAPNDGPPDFSESGHLRRGVWAVKDGPAAPTQANWGQSARRRDWPLFLRGASRYSSTGHPTEHAMNPFLWLVDTVITLYIWILIAAALLSWLVAFNVVNARNPIVANIGEFLYRVTEPALRPIRSVLPNLGGIDISPVILIIGLLFLKQLIFWLYIQIFL
jgi:YggT family protein